MSGCLHLPFSQNQKPHVIRSIYGSEGKVKTLLSTKLGMTQLLAEDGKAIPVTLIRRPCHCYSGEDRRNRRLQCGTGSF